MCLVLEQQQGMATVEETGYSLQQSIPVFDGLMLEIICLCVQMMGVRSYDL